MINWLKPAGCLAIFFATDTHRYTQTSTLTSKTSEFRRHPLAYDRGRTAVGAHKIIIPCCHHFLIYQDDKRHYRSYLLGILIFYIKFYIDNL